MSTTYGSEQCFFCAKPTPKKKLTWEQQYSRDANPEGTRIYRMHLCPKCAVSLGIRLTRDGLQLCTGETRTEMKRQVSVCLEYELRGNAQAPKKGSER